MSDRLTQVKAFLKNPAVVLLGSFSLLMICQLYGAVFAEVFASGASSSAKILITIGSALAILAILISTLIKVLQVRPSAIGLVAPKKKWIVATAGGAIVYLIVASLLVVLASLLFPSFNADQAQDVGIGTLLSTSQYLYSFIALALLTPIFEEVVFRGVLFKGLRRKLPLWLAIGISSAMFALAHGQWNVALDTFAFGIVLAYLVEYTGSIWPSILLHATKNSVAFLLLFVLK